MKKLFKRFYANLIRRLPVESALAEAQRHVLETLNANVDLSSTAATIKTPLWAALNVVTSRNNVRLEKRECVVARMAVKIMESVKDFPPRDDGVDNVNGRSYEDYVNGVRVLYNVIDEAWKRVQQVQRLC